VNKAIVIWSMELRPKKLYVKLKNQVLCHRTCFSKDFSKVICEMGFAKGFGADSDIMYFDLRHKHPNTDAQPIPSIGHYVVKLDFNRNLRI